MYFCNLVFRFTLLVKLKIFIVQATKDKNYPYLEFIPGNFFFLHDVWGNAPE